MQKVDVYFSKNDEVILYQDSGSFKGNMVKGQILTWTLTGKIVGLVDLGKGRTIFPLLRLEVHYRYPAEALKQEVKRLYNKGELKPFGLEDYLREVERK